jgi:hypothetical protein
MMAWLGDLFGLQFGWHEAMRTSNEHPNEFNFKFDMPTAVLAWRFRKVRTHFAE